MTTPTTDSTDLMAAPAIPTSTPLAFLEPALAGVQQYHAIMSALDLGLFDLLCRPQSSSECAAALGCRADLLGLVCESLVSTGLLEKAGDGPIWSAIPPSTRVRRSHSSAGWPGSGPTCPRS